MTDYIPEDLIVNVLLRLPYDSLIRSRCVSKSWCALIDSSYFVKLHLERNSDDYSQIIALNEQKKFYTFNLDAEVGSSIESAREINYPFEFSEGELEFMGSCNGLLCLMNSRTDSIVLWNPLIEKHYFELPSPPFEYSIGYRGFLGAAFGYDHVNDDYKVVKWNPFSDFSDALYGILHSPYRHEACIYSLKLNSWRRIGDFPFELPELFFFPIDCAFANGALHWLVMDEPVNGVRFILALDLSIEKFWKIPCNVYTNDAYKVTLWILNGCLCLLCFYSSSGRNHVDLWMMEDYGVEKSWTKFTSVELPSGLRIWYLWPVGYSRKRKQLLLQLEWKNLVVYDLETKSISNVAICGKVSCLESSVCVGSLVRPSCCGGGPGGRD